ncbi:MAG: hypothetical protein NVV60_11595 [Luteimonas sp.]|nr:hypothetical protein [Luteimonas sp.]
MPATPADASDTPDPLRLIAMLRDGDLDAAIEAGLMRFDASGSMSDDSDAIATIVSAQRQLQEAWEARERHRARAARLQRIASERAAKRTQPASTTSTKPSLPAAAASALARALAKASDGGKA